MDALTLKKLSVIRGKGENMKTIDGFKNKVGTLCISTNLRNLCNNILGCDYDESIYYGLGSGLFFAYTVTSDMVGIGGFAGDLILNDFCSNISAIKVVNRTKGAEDSFEEIKFSIDNNLPVLVFGLDFCSQERNEEEDKVSAVLDLPHMNYHFTMIVGYDEETKQLKMADHKSSSIVSIDKFLKLREPKNELIHILLPNRLENIEFRIYAALNKVCDYWFRMPENPKPVADRYTGSYLNLNSINNTMHGLNLFYKTFLRGIEIESLDNFKKTMIFLRILSYRGTGGDMTRGLFARFLKEAQKITGNEKFAELAKMYGNAANLWRKFFKMFEKGDEELYKEVTDDVLAKKYLDMVNILYETEHEAIYKLKMIVEEY